MEEPQVNRRAADRRIDDMALKLEGMQRELTANTVITQQVADVLASFRVAATLSKWLTTIAAGVSAVLAAWHLGGDMFNFKK